MTRKIGDTVFIQQEPDDVCAYCEKVAELRPYGKDGARICHACGTNPENLAATKKAFNTMQDGKVQ